MIDSLTCFKCHKDTATLTYEENRIYKVSCPCGCEYDFEHSSMKCAEEYHCKMLELYGEIDRADRLKAENAKLRELLGLAVEQVTGKCQTCFWNEPIKGGCQTFNCNWQWQHAENLKELGILQDKT